MTHRRRIVCLLTLLFPPACALVLVCFWLSGDQQSPPDTSGSDFRRKVVRRVREFPVFPLTPVTRAVGAGEVFEYEVLLNGIAGATLRVETRTWIADGIPCIAVESTGRPVPMVEWALPFSFRGRTLLDPLTLLPRLSTFEIVKGERRKRVRIKFDHAARLARVLVTESDEAGGELNLIEMRHGLDIMGAVMLLRAIELREGQSVNMEVISDDGIYGLRLTPENRATVAVPAGTFDALSIGAELFELSKDEPEEDEAGEESRQMRLYLSDDGMRVLLKVEAPFPFGQICGQLLRWRSDGRVELSASFPTGSAAAGNEQGAQGEIDKDTEQIVDKSDKRPGAHRGINADGIEHERQ